MTLILFVELFRVRGDSLEIFPVSSSENSIRVEFFGDEIDKISEIDSLTGNVIGTREHVAIYPASHFATSSEKSKEQSVQFQKNWKKDF